MERQKSPTNHKNVLKVGEPINMGQLSMTFCQKASLSHRRNNLFIWFVGEKHRMSPTKYKKTKVVDEFSYLRYMIFFGIMS